MYRFGIVPMSGLLAANSQPREIFEVTDVTPRITGTSAGPSCTKVLLVYIAARKVTYWRYTARST